MTTDDRPNADYRSLFAPMTDGDGPLIKRRNLLDAAIVGGIVFLSFILGDSLGGLFFGDTVYLTVHDLQRRALTAGIASGLTFLLQWARYRDLKIREAFNGG